MSRISYLRISTSGQSVEGQRHVLGGSFDREFVDEDVSGAIPAASRPAFRELVRYVREGDVVCVSAVDRLGRDALDIQATVRALINRGVDVHVQGLGNIGRGAGEIVLAVLAQIADLERERIRERTAAGRSVALASLAATGKTHRGKTSMGRPKAMNSADVEAWRRANKASIAGTAKHFSISENTVKRYCAEVARAS